ncbi:MAG: hypothetical protein ACI4Q4_08035 [Oscillospiraceae bacterium]
MKEKLPWISILSIAISLIIMLFMALFGFDLVGLGFICIFPLGAVLIAEIIGLVLRFCKKMTYADCIAVLITAVIALIAAIVYAINDLNSTGFFAGLGGMLVLIFVVPASVISLIADGVVFFRRRRKIKQQNNEEMH